jgi:hypothetical protein
MALDWVGRPLEPGYAFVNEKKAKKAKETTK